MSTKKLRLVSPSAGKQLKKLGFNYEVDTYINTLGDKNNTEYRYAGYFDNWNRDECKISIPSVPLALKWIRDKKGLFGYVQHFHCGPVMITNMKQYKGFMWIIYDLTKGFSESAEIDELVNTYDDAEIVLLKKLLKILKNKQS
jgi:hypothetical protein